jgi:PPM family protein phosphatase
MENAESSPFLGGTLLCYSSEYEEFKNKNQDSIGFFELTETSGVLVISDGIGGSRGGDQASKSILDTFAQELSKNINDELFDRAYQICINANKNVRSLNLGAGATLSAVFFNNSKALIISVGDSPIYHYSATGQLKNESISFSVGGFMEKIQLRPTEAPKKLTEESNHLLTFVGGEVPSLFSQGPFDIKPRDIFLLCSDGISENITMNFLNKTISENEIESKGKKIIEEAKKTMRAANGKPDDHSLILLDFSKIELK